MVVTRERLPVACWEVAKGLGLRMLRSIFVRVLMRGLDLRFFIPVTKRGSRIGEVAVTWSIRPPCVAHDCRSRDRLIAPSRAQSGRAHQSIYNKRKSCAVCSLLLQG